MRARLVWNRSAVGYRSVSAQKLKNGALAPQEPRQAMRGRQGRQPMRAQAGLESIGCWVPLGIVLAVRWYRRCHCEPVGTLVCPFPRIPSGHNPSSSKQRRGRCPHRPAPAKPELPGNPREVRTTFSAENGCCALRTPADIGCLLRNHIQNLPFRQRYAGKTVHLCCRSPHGERGLKFKIILLITLTSGRSPHGERGLK